MICQKCRMREASGYMEKTVGGVKTRIYLCPECFKQTQIEMFSSIDDMGLFSGLSGMAGQHIRCSKCGTTLKQISDNCFVGCPNCYIELENYIKPILRNIQSATMHIGSRPETNSSQGQSASSQSQTNSSQASNQTASSSRQTTSSTSSSPRQTNSSSSQQTQDEELIELEAQLRTAVDSENYELAMKLKERIDALKAGKK